MNDMKKDRLKFRTIGAYMSVVYVLIGLLTVAAIFCAWMIGFDSLLILLFAVLYLIAILMRYVYKRQVWLCVALHLRYLVLSEHFPVR